MIGSLGLGLFHSAHVCRGVGGQVHGRGGRDGETPRLHSEEYDWVWNILWSDPIEAPGCLPLSLPGAAPPAAAPAAIGGLPSHTGLKQVKRQREGGRGPGMEGSDVNGHRGWRQRVGGRRG